MATDASDPSSYLLSIPVTTDSGAQEQTITVEINENDSQFKNAVQTMISTTTSDDTGVGLLINNFNAMFGCSYRFLNDSQEQYGRLDSITSEGYQVLGIAFDHSISAEEFFNKLSLVGEVIIDVDIVRP